MNKFDRNLGIIMLNCVMFLEQEIGPRLKLRLYKIEEGLLRGNVVYNRRVVKTPLEIETQRIEILAKQLEKEKRKKEQEKRVREKEREANKKVTIIFQKDVAFEGRIMCLC